MTTFALVLLCIFGVFSMLGGAMQLSGNVPARVPSEGAYIFTVILTFVEVGAAFWLAHATGLTVVWVAAWVTLLFDLIGIVRAGLRYGKVYNPTRGYMWLLVVMNAATIIAFVYGYSTAVA